MNALRVGGAPFDQGVTQGVASARAVRDGARELRRRLGWGGVGVARRRAHLQCGKPMQRFLPQLHERLCGIASGARIAPQALELVEGLLRVQGVASVCGSRLEARLELPDGLPLLVRHSVPDAVGFASLELSAAPFAGCLAAINSRGLAAVAIEDRGGAPSLRSFAQDLILRASCCATAFDHVRLRAKYASGNGALVLLDTTGCALGLELEHGLLRRTSASRISTPIAKTTVALDCSSLTLSHQGGTFSMRSEE